MEGTGVVPVMDVNNNHGCYGYGDGFGYGGGCWIWIILLFALFGNGWNNNNNHQGYDVAATFANGSMTRGQIADEFDFNDMKNGIRGVQNGLCDGFYAQNTTMLQGFNGIGREVLDSRYQIGGDIANNRFAMKECCCNLEKEAMVNRNEAFKNTCDITNAIHMEGQATRALIEHNEMQNLRDRLEAKDRDLLTARFQLSQQAQSANLIDELRPCAKPSYITCSPYQASYVGFGYNGFNGFNGGCGCA